MSNTTEKLTGYQLLKNQNEELMTENIQLSQKVKDLWEKAANLDIRVLDKQRESEALKVKLEALNETARQNLVKKNFEIEQIEILKKENEALIQKVGGLNEIKESVALENLRLKSQNENLNGAISGLQKKVVEFNEFKTVQDKAAKDKDAVLNSLNIELAKFKNENEILKANVGAKNSRMYAFKTVVIFLAVLANYFLLGKKFMNLTGENDWQTYLISYGSVLIFDLTVILLTLLNKSKEALYFAVGVFILTFLQIAKPFEGLGLDVDFLGFNLQYFERFVSGGIYSVFFAFLPYFLSKITKE